MISYIKSEWYRLTREKSYWIFMIVFTALAVAASLILYVFNKSTPAVEEFPYANTRFLIINLSTSMVIPFFFLNQISQMVVGEEMKQHTLKNSVSFGVSRATIFFGKWIVSVIGLLLIAVVSITISVASAYLLLENSGVAYLVDFCWVLVGIIPIMLVGLTTYHFLYFISPSANSALAIFTGIYLLPYIVCGYLAGRIEAAAWLYKYLPMTLLMNNEMSPDKHLIMAGNSVAGMERCWIVGCIVIAFFLTFGYKKFKNMDIK